LLGLACPGSNAFIRRSNIVLRVFGILLVLLTAGLSITGFSYPLSTVAEESGNPWWIWPVILLALVVFVFVILRWWLRGHGEEEEEVASFARAEPVAPSVAVEATEPRPVVEAPEVIAKAPTLDVEAPASGAELPQVEVKAPSLGAAVPDVEVKAPSLDVDLPDVEIEAPSLDVDLPDVEVKAPSLDVDLPEVGVKSPSLDVAMPEIKVAAPVTPPKRDDLKLIEGIGPKISSVLRAGGITTFAHLASTDVDQIRQILEAADPRLLRLADPRTWPEQAGLAADGNWEALEKLQDDLYGGRRT
jgi:predicted flap endonuclease-1-like 5' DNA nuclease